MRAKHKPGGDVRSQAYIKLEVGVTDPFKISQVNFKTLLIDNNGISTTISIEHGTYAPIKFPQHQSLRIRKVAPDIYGILMKKHPGQYKLRR